MGRAKSRAIGVVDVFHAIHRQMDVMLAAPYHAGQRAVHVQRVSAKRIRAWLRLVERDIGSAAFRQENTRFRDIARSLQSLRDHEMTLVTFERLTARTPDWFSEAEVTAIKAVLGNPLLPMVSGDSAAVFSSVAHAVQKARGRFLDLHPAAGSSGILRGLRRGFRRAGKLHDLAGVKSDDVILHDLRKESKYLLYQLEILQSVWPKPVAGVISRLSELCEILGDDHDLIVLAEALAARSLDATLVDRCREVISAEAKRLQDQARAIGDDLFGDPSAAFMEEFATRWRE